MRINEENYVAKAESVILKLSKQVNKQGKLVAMVTNSKIRNLYPCQRIFTIRC